MRTDHRGRAGQAAGLICLLLLAGCATSAPSTPPPTTLAAVGEIRPGIPMPRGYLPPEVVPDSLALVPPPPAADSAAFAADQEAYRAAAAAPADRFALAAADADLRWPAPVAGFEAIVGAKISTEATPHTAMLLQRALADAGLSTYRAKEHYKRPRPFVVNGSSTCTPKDEASLRNDGSYPSGHTAIGWMLALVLTDLVPAKTDALLQRGYDYGQSRLVCRVHWMSDTVAGRLMASATYARLQSDPVFRAQRELARAELARALPR
jgi:acid phosphatase (class A)